MTLEIYLAITVGSALGGALRYFVSGLAAIWFGETFPWGTMIVNVAGSFVIGFFATLTAADGRVFVSAPARQFILLGLCGGFTTFSSFSVQTMTLLRDREWLYAGGNVVGSVTFCLIAVWLGHLAAAVINQLRGA